MKKDRKGNKRKRICYFFYDFVKLTGILPVLVWLHPQVYHMGDRKKHTVKGGMLVTSNHIGYRDPLLLQCVFWRRRLFSLVTKDLYKNGLMEWMLNAVHCIKVDKENFSMQSFHKVSDLLGDGRAVLIFPEGEVNQTDSMLSFKTGAVLMAHKNRAAILPVYIKTGEKWYHRNVAVIGDPIDVRAICGNFPSMDALKRASDHVRMKEKELEAYFYAELQKAK